MPLQISMQFNIVFFSILAGIITGILFDMYRIIRGLSNFKAVVIVEDILFWILASIIVFTFLLYTNYAFLTPYVYIFICCTILLYMIFISKYFYSIEKFILDIIFKIIRVILKNLSYPLKLAFYKIIDKNK
ncbi:spore cortex biosynthesis protein YabQ [Clostridium neonatale]|uniref:spore cortex biosynthesis protein YabQ n=1 Tax=Clostridium neonatale TaxID=137838 RepID=UPI00291C34F5|nr:spore cortex biosynthesis protein YabQ [Clostridium neonatale]CAI3678218.1 putative spore cortex protein,yabQ-like [Clostridium neonatale]CAI3701360.1 putative spore cortex protein,yabQ-like [Clostridium neonatale]